MLAKVYHIAMTRRQLFMTPVAGIPALVAGLPEGDRHPRIFETTTLGPNPETYMDPDPEAIGLALERMAIGHYRVAPHAKGVLELVKRHEAHKAAEAGIFACFIAFEAEIVPQALSRGILDDFARTALKLSSFEEC